MLQRWLLYVGSVVLGLGLVGALLVAFVLALLYPTLPSLETLTDYQPKIPLRIVSAEGELLGEFGEERRAVVSIGEVPDVMKKAILAAEDERFYQHGGVDYLSVLRAALSNLASGTQQGAGTITMQVARNFFLTREKTVTRKLREVLLAWKIEANLSKDEILQLYVNQIFLGQRAYGFAAAAQIYFGKPLKDVSIAEAAMLAGLPKAPSAFNPVTNPRRAKTRQLYVLRRMHDLRYIDDAQFRAAQDAPLAVKQGLREVIASRVGIRGRDGAAGRLRNLRRRRVHEGPHRLDDDPPRRPGRGLRRGPPRRARLRPAPRLPRSRGLFHAADRGRRAGGGPRARVPGHAGLRQPASPPWSSRRAPPRSRPCCPTARPCRSPATACSSPPARSATRRPPECGSGAARVIRVAREDKSHWGISQLPQVESAFVSVRPTDGAIHSLVGGFDYDRSKFNHVTQAQRQPGSSFKPFIYSAALEKGFTPATIVNDAPFYVPADNAGGEAWEPKNYDGKFDGPLRDPDGARQVEEPRQRARDAGDRAALRAGLHRPLRLRSQAAPALPVDGAGRGVGHAAADGRRVQRLRQRRLPGRRRT